MTVTINFTSDELQKALQTHLETAVPIQSYIRAALRFFDSALELTDDKSGLYTNSKEYGSRYGKQLDPREYLRGDK